VLASLVHCNRFAISDHALFFFSFLFISSDLVSGSTGVGETYRAELERRHFGGMFSWFSQFLSGLLFPRLSVLLWRSCSCGSQEISVGTCVGCGGCQVCVPGWIVVALWACTFWCGSWHGSLQKLKITPEAYLSLFQVLAFVASSMFFFLPGYVIISAEWLALVSRHSLTSVFIHALVFWIFLR